MRVLSVHRYPVKSMQGERPVTVELDQPGVVGDRRYGVCDLATGRILSAKEEPRLLQAAARTVEDGVAIDVPGGADLSTWLGRDVQVREAADGSGTFSLHIDHLDDDSELVEWDSPPGSFTDEAPVHLLTTAALRAMAALAPRQQWVERRFRPNLVIDVEGDGFVEDDWVGGHLRVGEVVLAPFKQTTRCSMIGRPQPDGIGADLDVIRAVRDHHRFKLGVHARVVVGGTVEVGARVEQIEGVTPSMPGHADHRSSRTRHGGRLRAG